jgi:hypothetical protein
MWDRIEHSPASHRGARRVRLKLGWVGEGGREGGREGRKEGGRKGGREGEGGREGLGGVIMRPKMNVPHSSLLQCERDDSG